MKGILGKKLGMTQVFDPETGAITPVTVIAGGPVPGRRRCAPRRPTATTPSSSPSSEVAERKLTKAELGHLKKDGVGAAPAPRRVPRTRASSTVGETVTVEAFEPGDRVKVAGTGIGKGFAGTIKRHNFSRGPMSHGSHNIRKPGSIGASAHALARVQGHEDGRPHGRQARHAGRARSCTSVDPERNLLLVKGAVPGPEERPRRDQGGREPWPRLRHPCSMPPARQASRSTLDEAVFGAEVKPHLVHETVRAELNAAPRRARALPRAAGWSPAAAPSRGARRAPAAPAPGTIRAPQFTGGGVAFPPAAARLRGQGQPQGAEGRAALGALGARGSGHARASSTAARSTRPRRRRRSSCSPPGTRQMPLVVVAGEDEEALTKSFRNLERVLVIVPGRARGRRRRLGALAARHRGPGAAQLVERRARSEALLHPNEVLLAPVVSEKSYSLIEDRKYSFRVHPDAHKTQIRQAVEQLFERQRRSREHHQGAAQAEAARHASAARGPAGRRRSCSCARARRSRSSRGLRSSHGRSARSSRRRPGRRFMTVSDFAEVTKTEPEKRLLEPLTKKGGRNNNGRITTRHQGGGHKRRYRIDRLQAPQGRRAGEGRRDRVRPEPVGADRAAALRRRREGLHPRARRLEVGATRRVRARAPTSSPGNALPLREHPDRHARAQRRAEARQGRPAGAQRRRGHPARREGRGLRRCCGCPPARCAACR